MQTAGVKIEFIKPKQGEMEKSIWNIACKPWLTTCRRYGHLSPGLRSIGSSLLSSSDTRLR